MANNEPKVALERAQTAPILSYNVPEPTSYSGRNFIDLQLGESYFKPNPVTATLPTVGAPGKTTLGATPAEKGARSPIDPSLLATEPLSPRLAKLNLQEVEAMRQAGK